MMLMRLPLTDRSDARLIAELKLRFAAELARLNDLHRSCRTGGDWVRLSAARFRAARVGRRLRMLVSGRLLDRGVPSLSQPADLLSMAIAEVRAECARRGLTLRYDEPCLLPRTFIDSVQAMEALRSILDAILEAAGPGGRISAETACEGDEVQLVMLHDAERPLDALDAAIARRLVERMGGALRFGRRGGATEITLCVPRSFDWTHAATDPAHVHAVAA